MPAERLGMESILIVTEGDWASSMIREGLSSLTCMPRSKVGYTTIGGIPMNVRKQIKNNMLNDDITTLVPYDSFLNNQRFRRI